MPCSPTYLTTATPRVNARIEPPHGLRDGWPVRIRNLDLDGRESSVLDAFGVTQMSAVGMRQAVPSRVDASPIIFADRDAFNLVANPSAPLAISKFEFTGGGDTISTYGGVLEVVSDLAGIKPNCAVQNIFGPSPTCTSIGFGGGGFGAGFTFVWLVLRPLSYAPHRAKHKP
jgi:hypothetical protein